ncbi:unnamed protein product, partial [Sphagnum tenellum]
PGTSEYMAPEICSNQASTKSDVYSFGVLLIQLMNGSPMTLYGDEIPIRHIIQWPQLWHTICSILEGPLGSFPSTSNHNQLPRCLLVQHKCKESNGLILCWLKFASRSLLQIFIKVGSLVALLPSISSHMFIWLCGSMQQQE